MDVLPWWWRVGAPWAERIAPRLVPLCPRHGYAWLCGTVARAGLPAAVRAEHLVAASLLAAIGGAAVAGAGLWVVPGVGPNGALAGLARTSGWSDALSWTLAGAGLAGPLPALWLRARVVERRRRIERELPFVLDMMILCVEAGLSVQAALQQATSSVPGGPLREGVAGALAQMRGGRGPVHGIARDGGSLRQSAGARLDCRPGPGGRPGHRPVARVAGAGRPVSSCPPAAGRAIGAAGAGQDAAAPGRLHLSLHVHRAGVPHRRPAAAGGERERPPGPAARAAQAVAGQGLDGAAAGVAGPAAARATIGDLAGAMPGGAYLRHAIRHRRGVRVARWLRAEGVQGVAAPPDRVMPRRCGRCRSSGWRC